MLSACVLCLPYFTSKHKYFHHPFSSPGHINITTMLSFTDLPPEIRKAIYKIQLQSTLEKTTPVLYSGQNPLRCGDTPHCIRHTQPFKRTVPDGPIEFLDARIIYARDIKRAKYNIHHADLDDLLPLASTCRLIRSDLLALAWYRAEIHVASPELYNELRCVFYDRLTTEACNFIRTLEIDVHEKDWLPSETRKIAGLIRSRLPHLEKLTVNIILPLIRHKRVPFTPGLAAFRILPASGAVDFNHDITVLMLDPTGSPRDLTSIVRSSAQRKPEIVALNSLRTKLSRIGQRRKERQEKRQLADQADNIFQARIKMRSPQPLQSLPPTQAGAPQKVRLVNLY
jgi:hypothetical protein